ncbi:hypothetical protein [Lactiplantibacillus modestisalitolerans]|uniref:Uncharacterized protein n=1 Tax=Lactiplantibacillus modestisalitolerans TaxID=1457219 RepID=A0ABV5WSB3_9LACO
MFKLIDHLANALKSLWSVAITLLTIVITVLGIIFILTALFG